MAKQLHELEQELAEAVEAHNTDKLDKTGKELANSKQKIQDLRAQVQEILTDGAKGCPECGNHPVGIHQPSYFFVGCLSPTCSERRSRGGSVKLAVMAWNDEVYFERRAARARVAG